MVIHSAGAEPAIYVHCYYMAMCLHADNDEVYLYVDAYVE